MAEPLVEIKNVTKRFPIHGGFFSRQVGAVHAVENVSLEIHTGETLGLVGESGCGKSTLGRVILRLLEATSGKVIYEGDNILDYSAEKLRALRRKMQIIFQDPYASLNPRMTIGNIIGEPLIIHKLAKGAAIKEKVMQLLETVGLRPETLNRYPHEFSGGQRQRVGIARALAVKPKFIVADEPISALDVSIQAQILNLLMDLQEKFNLTYLFIAHDLHVVEHICDRVAVMYLGHIVELMPGKDLRNNALHPYSQALLSAVPNADPSQKKERTVLEGDVPSPINPPTGCPFHTRCPLAITDQCKIEMPPLREVQPGHFVACHLVE